MDESREQNREVDDERPSGVTEGQEGVDESGRTPRSRDGDQPELGSTTGDVEGGGRDGLGNQVLDRGGRVPESGDGGDGYGPFEPPPITGETSTVVQELRFERSGPLPDPNELAGYEAVLPGLADRIVTMAEKAQDAYHETQLVPLRSEARAFGMATFGVTFLPWLLGGAAITFAIVGLDVIAIVTGLGAAVSAGPQIIGATRRSFGKNTN